MTLKLNAFSLKSCQYDLTLHKKTLSAEYFKSRLIKKALLFLSEHPLNRETNFSLLKKSENTFEELSASQRML